MTNKAVIKYLLKGDKGSTIAVQILADTDHNYALDARIWVRSGTALAHAARNDEDTLISACYEGDLQAEDLLTVVTYRDKETGTLAVTWPTCFESDSMTMLSTELFACARRTIHYK